MKVKNKVKLAFLNAAVAIGSVGTGLYVGMAQACATNDNLGLEGNYTVAKNLKFSTLQSKLMALIFLVLRIVGAVWAIMGIMKVVGSLKDDRPEDIKSGIASAVAGIALVVAPSLLQAMGILTTGN